MKGKLAALLMLTLTVGLVGGCGKDSQAETSSQGTGKRGVAISEYLSTEKTVCYTVSKMDKERTPDNMYFFEDGKVTILPGEEFGKNLGELSRMTDKEIWNKYEKVKEEYAKKYAEKKDASIENIVAGKIAEEAGITLEELDSLIAAQNNGYDVDSVWEVMHLVDRYLYEGGAYANYSEEDIGAFFNNFEESPLTKELVDGTLAYYQNAVNNAKSKSEEIRKELSYKGPFFQVPFSLAVVSDSSGNAVKEEQLLYATLADELGKAPKTYYQSFTFGGATPYESQIYDMTYTCLESSSGNTIFCVRDSVKLDGVDSKTALVDPTEKQVKKLFKEEVNARYE